MPPWSSSETASWPSFTLAVTQPPGPVDPEWWTDLMETFHDRPTLTRAVGAAQIAAGIWWALSDEGSE